jgi:hypothetical protein
VLRERDEGYRAADDVQLVEDLEVVAADVAEAAEQHHHKASAGDRACEVLVVLLVAVLTRQVCLKALCGT